MARFERVPFDPGNWGRILNDFPDRIAHQSPAYIQFLAETQNAEPVLGALKEGQETLGYFMGLIVRRFGFKILGCPFRGWSTPYMGFNLAASVPRRTAVEALPEFAFNTLGCVHVELTDLHLKLEDIAGLGFDHQLHGTVVNDLTLSEEQLMANMNSYRRRDIRRAEKHGVTIEEVSDDGFADEFAEQFKEVFAKQGMVPHYGADRVRALIRHFQPTGHLLRLRARDPEKHSIATGIFIGIEPAAFYWGGASWRQYQHLHPNELLQWYSMRYWKSRGMKTYNLAGTMEFKKRFGGAETSALMIFKSKYRLLTRLRSAAMPLGRAVLRAAWKFRHKQPPEEP